MQARRAQSRQAVFVRGCLKKEVAVLAELKKISYGFEDVPVLEEIEASVSEGDRIGLVGTNGAGKTTLLSLLVGERTPDEGEVFLKSGLRLGYLKQGSGLDSQRTVLAEMREVFADLWACEARMREIERAFAGLDHQSPEYRRLAGEYERCNAFFAANDGYGAEVRIRTVLGGMGISGREDQQISTMSGGEKTRLKLCRLLLEQPEILFLDEPTNHLDVSTMYWLEEYLKGYRGAIFTVSHDRFFLDAAVGKILELENCRVRAFRGNYSKYKILKAELYEHELKEYEKQQEEIAALQDYVARNIVRATTAKSAQSRVKKLESMERLEKPLPPPKPPKFAFAADERSEERTLSVEGLTLTAGGRTLLQNANFSLRRGEKAAVVGENGAGKSTLIRAIVQGNDPAVRVGRFTKIGYYDQENADIDPAETVLGALWHRHTYMSQTQARSMLAQAKLCEDDIEKPVSSLSGGERAKLALVLLEAQRANLLILDEPTNHLDLQARESLEAALRAFEGTLLFVSHDRYFIQNIAGRIIEIANGELTCYPCDYEAYTAQKRAADQAAEAQAKAEKQEARAAQKDASHRTKAERAQEAKRKQQAKQTEERIAALEEEAAALTEAIGTPAVAADYKLLAEKCARLDEVHAALDALYAEYEKLI